MTWGPMKERDLWRGLVAVACVGVLAAACGGARTIPASVVRFGEADETFVVPGLDECDLEETAELRVHPERPLVVIVHGCNASGGRFRALAQVFEAHGQQTVCFNYDDRESMLETSANLRRALVAMEDHLHHQPITVLGHSQGGLVSRRALARGAAANDEPGPGASYRLITVSSPFNGIAASAHCASVGLHVATLGITALVCHAIAGDKWDEIHPDAEFMRAPGELLPGVEEHLVVVTDERGSCRRFDDAGTCVEDDFVFSVEEQWNGLFDGDERVGNVEVKAGHAAIVGGEDRPPIVLIDLLRGAGVLARAPATRREEIAALLGALY